MRALLLTAALLVAAQAHAGVWTHHSDGTVCSGSSCDGLAPAAPTYSAGDTILIYSIVSSNGGARTLATPSGYVRLDSTADDSSTVFNHRLFCKVATSSETMPALDWSGSGNTVIMQAVTFSGPTAPNCATMVHASAAGTATSGFFLPQSLTITHTNNLVLSIGAKLQDGSPVDYNPIACPSDVTTGRMSSQTSMTAFWPQSVACYRIETTAVSVSSANHFTPADEEATSQVSFAVSLEQQDSVGGGFTAGPIGAAVSNSVASITYTATASATIKCGMYLPGATPPTAAQVQAGTGAHGTATDTATGSSRSFNVTTSDGTPAPYYGIYCTPDGGTTVSAVQTVCLLPPSGKQYIQCPGGLTGIGSGSAIESLNALITPDWAIGDIPKCDVYTHATPGGTQQFLFHLSATGFASYESGTGARTYANCDAWDLSAAAWATVANANNDLDWWDQDPIIVCVPPFDWILKTSVAASSAPNPGNLNFATLCTHPLGDTITTALTSGTWPTGISLTANVASGTPTVENEGGVILQVTPTTTVTGIASPPISFAAYVWTTLTSPNCTSSLTTLSACVALYNNLFHSAITLVQPCHSSGSTGNILATSPAAAAEVAPYDTVVLVTAAAQAVCAGALIDEGEL